MPAKTVTDVERLGELFAVLEQTAEEVAKIAEKTKLQGAFNLDDAGAIIQEGMEKLARVREESPEVSQEFDAGRKKANSLR